MTRLRDLGITIGEFPTGPHNAITDVASWLVGHATIIHDAACVADSFPGFVETMRQLGAAMEWVEPI